MGKVGRAFRNQSDSNRADAAFEEATASFPFSHPSFSPPGREALELPARVFVAARFFPHTWKRTKNEAVSGVVGWVGAEPRGSSVVTSQGVALRFKRAFQWARGCNTGSVAKLQSLQESAGAALGVRPPATRLRSYMIVCVSD